MRSGRGVSDRMLTAGELAPGASRSRPYDGESPSRRTVTDMCFVAPSVAPTLVTIHVTPSRSSLSPTWNTRSVNQYSVLPSSRRMVRVRGTAPSFPPRPAQWHRLGHGGGGRDGVTPRGGA